MMGAPSFDSSALACCPQCGMSCYDIERCGLPNLGILVSGAPDGSGEDEYYCPCGRVFIESEAVFHDCHTRH